MDPVKKIFTLMEKKGKKYICTHIYVCISSYMHDYRYNIFTYIHMHNVFEYIHWDYIQHSISFDLVFTKLHGIHNSISNSFTINNLPIARKN